MPTRSFTMPACYPAAARRASSAGSSDQPATIAVAGHVRDRPHHRAGDLRRHCRQGNRVALHLLEHRPRLGRAARSGLVERLRCACHRKRQPVLPVERGLVAVGEPQLGRRLVADADAVAAHQPGGQHRADRGQVGVVAPGHPGQHHPLRPVPGDRVHRAHAGPGQAEPAQLQRRVPERQPPRLELGRDEHERDGRPAHTISTIRSIAPRARAATSSGTVTGCCISRRLSRSLGRVICFM